MTPTVETVVADFGRQAKEKFSNPVITGEPEDQLRAPFEFLLVGISALCGFSKGQVVAVGETTVEDLKTRPDYAVTVRGPLVGFVELKAPGKGADPRKFKDPHDKEQWSKLSLLPNLIYSDGNSFSLWRSGELQGAIVHLDGDVETSGDALASTPGLLTIFESFLSWEPQAPRSAKELAEISARLCRLLRDEVTEQLALKNEALTNLATDWRMLLFPDAADDKFADGYAQAVTFGLLMARAQGIELSKGFQKVAKLLGMTSSLIGAALGVLTTDAEDQASLKTSLSTLTRVLEVVDWAKLSKGKTDTWLYFYEDFLEVYDNTLRKQTGSYYTPPEVVNTMVRWVDEALRSQRYNLSTGLAHPTVTFVDPATGTGTYLLGMIRRIAERVKADEGEGAVAAAIQAAIGRLVAFEMQLGPFAVAQLRVLAEIVALTGSKPVKPLQMFVTDTLADPHDDAEHIFQSVIQLARSRKEANKIKRETPVTVVLGNPPYKEKAMGKGGWIEKGNEAKSESAPLDEWMPPSAWKTGAHSKHLRNLYVYFWRWATWKVYDHGPGAKTGIVCFITVAGFLNGPGFQKMRDYLRRTCDDIWVVDCTPEGHQPEVNTRIFQGVQQPVCIVLASRSASNSAEVPANVRFRALPTAHRDIKFESLDAIGLLDAGWTDCPLEWRAPFFPGAVGAWSEFPLLSDLFVYNGSGVMPGRTWVIAPDADSLVSRWNKLIGTPPGPEQEKLFHPHLRGGKVGDKHSNKKAARPLAGQEARLVAVSTDKGPCIPPIRYGFRSFDRQWVIPDVRLINQPNPGLWDLYSGRQIFLTVLERTSPSSGPAITFTDLIPDHYKGSFGGRVYPLWQNSEGTKSNIRSTLLEYLSERFNHSVSAEDFLSYIAAILAHPGYTTRFQKDMSTPGLRIPITADAARFFRAAKLGRRVIWLHSYGERMVDESEGRPAQRPRLPTSRRPNIPKEGSIPPGALPADISYDPTKKRLQIGAGFVANVEPAVWSYEVSGKKVLVQWFSYRKLDRSRPQMGDRRPPSPLGNIQPITWLAEYTTDLLNLLNVLSMLVELEPEQADLLNSICDGALITTQELVGAGIIGQSDKNIPKANNSEGSTADLFS